MEHTVLILAHVHVHNVPPAPNLITISPPVNPVLQVHTPQEVVIVKNALPINMHPNTVLHHAPHVLVAMKQTRYPQGVWNALLEASPLQMVLVNIALCIPSPLPMAHVHVMYVEQEWK